MPEEPAAGVSYAHVMPVTCPACGHMFTFDIWLIVDAVARPDLVERIRGATLHNVACPRCEAVGQANASLLLYRPDAEPAILFSPAEQTTSDQDWELAGQLVGMLRQSLGEVWHDDWLARGLPSVRRAALPVVLSNESGSMVVGAQGLAPLGADDAIILAQAMLDWALSGQQVALAQDQLTPALVSAMENLAAREEGQRADVARQLVSALHQALAGGAPDAHPRNSVSHGDRISSNVPPQFLSDLQQTQEAEQRYRLTGDRSALDAGAAAWERILRHPAFASFDERLQLAAMNDAGNIFLRRYWAAGRHDDLNRALELWRGAVGRTPPDSPDLPRYLNNLGNGLSDRYARTGQLIDLEEAIVSFEGAVGRTPPDSPDLPSILNNLGTGLRARYARTGQLADLEEAIRVWQGVVGRTPLDSPDLPLFLNNLGNGLSTRYARTGQLVDLEEAIRICQWAVERTPPDSPNLPSRLNNLGTGLSARYARTGQLVDLEEAIRVWQGAVGRMPSDSLELPIHLSTLGTGLRDRYALTGQLADLEEAIRVCQEAVGRTPPDSPKLPGYLNNLGNGLHDRYNRTGQLADLEEARTCYRHACSRGLSITPEEALRSARNWGERALERRAWQEGTEAYAFGRQAEDLLFATQIGRQAKESWLKEAQSLPANAAYALARRGRLEEATEALEGGRARLLAEALEANRRDLEHLAALGHGDLLARYRAAAERIAALQAQASQSTSGQAAGAAPQRDFAALTQEIQAARGELGAAIAAIRQVPGYEDFFLPPAFAKIQQAAAPGAPLVYLSTTSVGSVALVVHSQTFEVSETSKVSALWLDDLTEAQVREAVYGPADNPALGGYLDAYDGWRRDSGSEAACDAWHAALDATMHWLWDKLMSDVVRTLTAQGCQQAVLVPTGLLALLPLHAAWTEDSAAPTGRRYALDALALSYAPNAGALTASRETAARVRPDGVLAVDNPDGSLVFSTHEVDAVLSYFPQGRRKSLAAGAATREAVLTQFTVFPVYHLSTHGWAGWDEPLQGGLLLAGGQRLTLADILDLRLTKARLAVLSACETGIPGTKLPDEVIGLPAGLLQAGVAGVVASLWSVNDMSTAMLMERFYRLWREDGLEPALALRQAQIWLRDSTNREKAEYFRRDVPALAGLRMPAAAAAELYVDYALRTDLDARAFAHPFWWAAFSLTGV